MNKRLLSLSVFLVLVLSLIAERTVFTVSEIDSLATATELGTMKSKGKVLAATTNGLVGYWKFDEVAGTTAIDNSGNSNTATLNNISFLSGKINNAINLYGTSSYASVPQKSILNPSQITFSFWLKLNSIGSVYEVIAKGSTDGYKITILADGKIRFTDRLSNVITSDLSLNSGEWYHVAITGNSDGIAIYINSNLNKSGGTSYGGSSSPYSMYIGSNTSRTGGFLNGIIDELRIYSRALSYQEILDLYYDTGSTLSQGAGGGGGIQEPIIDTTAPEISNVGAIVQSVSSVQITWSTNEDTDSQVEYGLSASYGNFTVKNTSLIKSHSVNISTLQPSTLYHFRVLSSDSSGNVSISNDITFTTASVINEVELDPNGTTVYLRDGNAGLPKQITNITESSGKLKVVIPGHGFSVNDKISIQGVYGCWRANGTRTVVTVVGPDIVEVKARDGVTPLDCGGSFVTPANAVISSSASKLRAYKLKSPPNTTGFDGPDGIFTNSLSSRISSSNPAWMAMKARAESVRSRFPFTFSTNEDLQLGALSLVWHAEGRSPSSPYLPIIKSLLSNNHQIYMHSGCIETMVNCGRYTAFDQISANMNMSILAFSIAGDQLSPSERKAFLDKNLNDKALDNSSQTECVNPYTTGSGTASVTSGSNIVTLSPSAIAALSVGDLITYNSSSGSISDEEYRIVSINTVSGTVTLSRAVGHTSSSANWWFVKDYKNWAENRCGWLWLSKHNNQNALVGGPYHSSVNGPYPPDGISSAWGSENHIQWRSRFYLELGAATCPYDIRGCALYEAMQSYFWDNIRIDAKNLWTGITPAGGGAYRGRMENATAVMANNLRAQLMPSIDVTGGNYLKENMVWSIFQLLPGSSSLLHTYGETSQPSLSAYQSSHTFSTLLSNQNTTEASWLRWWILNSWNRWTQSFMGEVSAVGAALAFLGYDPSLPTIDYRQVLPTQRLWWESDLSENWIKLPVKSSLLALTSRTGWGSFDTSIFSAPLGMFGDHSYFKHIGHYQIYNGSWLYANNSTCSVSNFRTGSPSSCFTAPGYDDSHVEIGRPASTATSYEPYVSGGVKLQGWTTPNPSGIEFKRWAGTRPAGRTESDYAYAAWDVANAFNTSLMGVTPNYQRYNFLHVKEGGRDFMFRYVSTSLPVAKPMRTYLHFPNNGQSGEGMTSSDQNGIIKTATDVGTSMHTKVLLPGNSSQTDFHVTRTSSNVLTINENASVSYPVRLQIGNLNCSYTRPETISGSGSNPVFIWVRLSDCAILAGSLTSLSLSSGIVSGGSVSNWPSYEHYKIARWGASSGWNSAPYASDALPHSTMIQNERRFVVDLGNSTSSEYMVFHDIHRNQTDLAKTANIINSSAGWYTVQIAGSLPTVVAFSSGNTCKNNLAINSDHAGQGLYILAGLCQGTYQLRYNNGLVGSLVSRFGDESVKFAGASGAWTVSFSSSDIPPISPPTDTTAPTISGISVSPISTSTATILWTTNEASDTQVEYGTTLSYGSSSTLKDNVTRVTSHSVSLTGLTPNTTYNYRVKSRDASGNLVISENQTFKTLAIGQTSSKPTGSFDGVDTTKAFGWASDSDTPTVGIDIHLYIDKNAGTVGATPILVKADQNRSDVGNHAFNYIIPEQYRDNKPHSIWAWAIDSSGVGANNIQLTGSPKSFTLAPTVVIQPPPVPTATTTNVLRTIHIDLEGTTLKVATGVIQFVNSTNGAVVKEIPFTTNTNGDFSFYVPISLPSTIFIRVKITGYLPKKLDSPDLTTATPSTLNIPKLPAGDFNNDGVINSLDYAFLSQNWYKPAPSYDINRDGVINSLDYSILSRNWNKIGE